MSGPSALALVLAASVAACEPAKPPEPPPPPPPDAHPAPTCRAADNAPVTDLDALARAKIVLVCFSGNARLSEAALRDLVTSKEGQPYDAGAVAGDLRRLYGSGRLDDVRAEVTAHIGGVVLNYAVAERPDVRGVRFEGAHAVGEEALHTSFRSSQLASLDPAAVRAGLDRLRAEYADRGYPHAALTIRTSPAADGVELTVAIDEGALVKVASLVFAGAKAIPEAELGKMMETKVGEPYRASLFERDVLTAHAAYYDRGMIQAEIGAVEVISTPDKRSVAIRVPVKEGPVYRIHALKLDGNVGGDERAYRALLQVKVGDVFSRKKLLAGIEAIKALRKQRGLGESVEPRTELDPQKHLVSLTLALR